MSRTDKDRPYRVRAYFEGGVNHHHNGGECRVETRDQALTPTWRRGHHHYRTCKKYEAVEVPCTGALLVDARGPRTPWGSIRCYRKDTCTAALEGLAALWERYNAGDSCSDAEYNEKMLRRFFARYTYGKRYYCDRPHIRNVFHSDWPCVCDNEPRPATCDYTLSRADGGGYCSGGVPTWYCRETYHRPQRREMRDVLNDARRDYNANGDTEIEPVNRQARNEAHWSWW